MSKKVNKKLLNGFMAAAVVLSTTLTPMVANADATSVPSAVTRIGGVDQYATAALMAQKGWTGTTDNVVLSAGMNYALVDALAAGPLAAKLKAPMILTDSGQTLNPSAKAELLRLQPKKVYITSGTAVIKPSVITEIEAMGITVVPLGGYDQYETSVNIAKEMANQGVNISKVMLAAGWLSPADALSVAPIAAAQEIPILTTTQGQLPTSVQTYLDSIKENVATSYVVGGTAVVSEAVKDHLPGAVSRFAGETKYDTNVQVLKGFAKDYKNDKVYVANGETLVDALAGVPLAAADGAPVLLVNQQLDNAAKDFVKLNISTQDMVVLGGEAVVPTAGMNALTSAITYATDSATEGSTDAAKPLELTDNVQVTGDNVTLQNVKADYSVYVKGNNITLHNLTVKGTVFVDPGENGTATLDGVTAANIVILSGASDSINLRNTTADSLTVDSSSDVHIDATGTTTIGYTVVRSYAIIDANGASVGNVFITSTPGQIPVVDLRGTFTQPVVVSGEVILKAAEGAVVPSVVINTENSDQKVTLEGNFKDVLVQSGGAVDLAANTVVETMETTVKCEITVASGSSIATLDTGLTGTLVSGSGGIVNGEPMGTIPSSPTGSSGGGGGGGGSSSSAPKIATFAINNQTLVRVNGESATIDLSSDSNKLMLSSIQISASPANSTLQLTGFTGQILNDTFTLPNTITASDLLGSAIKDGDVSLGSMRALFGSSVTLNGTLTGPGNSGRVSSVSLTLNLGTSK
ncbi:MAG TPA: cell wall-binding repeat-containing protein [Desulfosporosinus sp.]|nr:cell wall-binding repeat-containing protein [Desulfosporosinus sp.]